MDLYSVNTFLLSLQKQLTVNLKEMQLERGGMGLYPPKEFKKNNTAEFCQNFTNNFILLSVFR